MAQFPGSDSSILTRANELENLYERFPWFYAFCRNHLFRDDTEKIVAALWPLGTPSKGESLLELGCGPGFYARRLASCFEHLQVTGIDRSVRQLRRAHAGAARLDNCGFGEGNVLALCRPDASVDSVVVSRLLFILSERKRALAEMHRVLRAGGRCFIAEARSALRAAAPLNAMQLLASLSDFSDAHLWRQPDSDRRTVLATYEFWTLIQSQPWRYVRCWRDVWYQYAVCEKGASQQSARSV